MAWAEERGLGLRRLLGLMRRLLGWLLVLVLQPSSPPGGLQVAIQWVH